MKIFHIVRNSRNISLFKEIILEVLHSGRSEEIFISSGFFAENTKARMSLERDITNTKDWLNVANRQNMTVYIKGCYKSTGRSDMVNFQNNLSSAGYKTQLLPYKSAHHAKVFIAQQNKIPIIEIIGSSNFTSKAYGTGKAYNIEADIVICNDAMLERVILSIIRELNIENGVMIYDYHEENNLGKPLIEQMIWIRDNLF